MMVMRMHNARLNEIKKRLRVHDDPAKNPYMTPVRAIVAAYIPAVDPIKIHCHKLELVEFSQFSRHISDQE